jgi:magnesium transporter
VDLVVDLSTGDYPTISHVLVSMDSGELASLPAPTDLRAHEVRVRPDARVERVDDGDTARMVLLQRDVMDALVLDLVALRSVRANDLWLAPTDGTWVLVAADISPWAVVRRLTRGWLGRDVAEDVLDWKHVEFLRGQPRTAADRRDQLPRVARLRPTQIARLTDGLPYMHAAELLTLLPEPLAADALEVMVPERQAQVITELERGRASRLIAEMAPDRAADLLGALELGDATLLLKSLPPGRSQPIADLLRYPPDSAGGIMTNELVIASDSGTVGQVLEQIRPALARPDFVYFVYLVDDEHSRRLRGVVTLRDLQVADPHTPVRNVMETDLVTVGPLESARETAHILADHGVNALPVVTPGGALLGIVTVDKAMAQLLPDQWRDNMPRVYS